MKQTPLRLLMAAVLSLPLMAQASDKPVISSFTLDNGMKIIVAPNHAIPNANMYLFWKVGSRNEVPGITGLSHFFEHMMFNGSKHYGPKMFDRTLEAMGGSNNAYTTENDTVYTDWFPSNAIETVFKLESDRIAHLDIDPKMVASEREVVKSERATGLENSNWVRLAKAVKGVAFIAHPYSWTVMGNLSDINAWTVQDLKQYHQTYYAPNNAVVVISGDVSLSQVKQLANQYFAPIPAQESPKKIRTVEPKQVGQRRVFVQKSSVQAPTIMLAYHVPETQHPDHYPLQLLSAVLNHGPSSLLQRHLVDKQIALATETYMPLSLDPNLFYVYAVAAPGVTENTLEHDLIRQINVIADKGVTKQQLQRAKNLTLMTYYQKRATIDSQSQLLGNYDLFYGGYKKAFDVPAALDKVTTADIQRVAKTYLNRANRTVGVLAAHEEQDQ